ncbi:MULTISPECIES: hypothetical protein [unclassified Pseudoalteromonas]|uniref:hypothetical protein n=1 Tax=unclassified Pseudoalteromonas TaxID=194690 RepID=UPI0005A7522C|nr:MULTISPECIES: hypothetical protein [unclassified Pseudoalteromonas]
MLITETSLDTDLYVFDTKTNGKKLVSDSIHQDLIVIPSLTNNKQLIVSRRLGKTQIFLKHNEQLSFAYANEGDAEYISPPIWSPNEENIAFSADEKLVFINLKKLERKLSTLDYDITRVLDWHENGNKVLLKGVNQGQDYYIINNGFNHIMKYNFPKSMFHLTGVSKKLNHLYF